MLILGAGAAGIGAARKLLGSKLSFFVLEGKKKVGGRIDSQFMTNTNPNVKEKVLISAGAQWLHGRRNPLFNYAKNKSLVVFDNSEEEAGLFMRDDGIEVNEKLPEEIEKIVEDILEEVDEIYYQENDEYPPSLDAYLTERFEEKIKYKLPGEKNQARQLLDWHKRETTTDNAAGDFKKISAKHWGRFDYIGGKWEHISLKNGFAEVLELMATDIGMNKFAFNKVIQKVHWTSELPDVPDGMSKGDLSNRRILVKCTDGTLYAANHVIVTFSLGVLKHDSQSLFVPALPALHKKAINCLGFGAITKIFVQFESSWWGENPGLQFVYRENEYDEDSNEPWTRYMSGLELVMTGPPNTLIGWVSGKGVELLETFTDKEIIDELMQHIEKFLGVSVPYPKRYFVSRWLNNPLARGSYSFACVDCDKDNITPKDLASPITTQMVYRHNVTKPNEEAKGTPLMLFAGEGCSQKYYSTAHGAYLSGEEQAKVIMNYQIRDITKVFERIFEISDNVNSLIGNGIPAFSYLEDIFESF